MKRRHFILGLAALPVVLDAVSGLNCLADPSAPSPSAPPPAPSGPDDGEKVTRDVFEGDFPPAVYGRTLPEVEATAQEVIERVFRDGDGILRSGVNGRTMKPMRTEEVKDRPFGLGTYVENSSFPREFKPVWLNYENAGQASGSYLDALCAKFAATGDPRVRERARRTMAALRTLWDNAAANKQPLGGTGRGWLPKPYDGIRDVTLMFECSVDQYCEVTHGLHRYYLIMADPEEKRQIEDIVASFAAWWFDHDYCGVYLGQGIWWKRLEWHSMAASYFLYLNALAQSWRPNPKFQRGFDIWWELRATLKPAKALNDVNMSGLTLKSLEPLMALRPDLTDTWKSAIAYQMPLLIGGIEGKGTVWKGIGNPEAMGADHLATVEHLMPGHGYGQLARRCLQTSMTRPYFYHIKRGCTMEELGAKRAGDDYRNIFWCENHVHWLAAYWKGRMDRPAAA